MESMACSVRRRESNGHTLWRVAYPSTSRGQFGSRGCRPNQPGNRSAINLPLDHRFEYAVAVVSHGFECLLAAFQRESMADEIV